MCRLIVMVMCMKGSFTRENVVEVEFITII